MKPLDLSQPALVDDFYRAHARTVLRWVIRLGGPRLDAEDVAHDVFIIAIKKAHTYRPGSSSSAWLYGITRRVVANARRRATFRSWVGLDTIAPPVTSDPDPEEGAELMRRRRLVQQVLDTLSAAHREVIVLSDLEGRGAPEVAEFLCISVGTVYSRLHHARKGFRSGLSNHRAELERLALRRNMRAR